MSNHHSSGNPQDLYTPSRVGGSIQSLLVARPADYGAAVKILLSEATVAGASAIHGDCRSTVFRIFYRLGGELVPILECEPAVGGRLVGMMRSLAGLGAGNSETVEDGELEPAERGGPKLPLAIIPFRPVPSFIVRLPDGEAGTIAAKASTRPLERKIFIWQMGKVGSSTVFNSLKPLTRPTTWEVSPFANDQPWQQYNTLVHTHSIEMLYDFFHATSEEFVVISLVRDLVARNVSSIFESMSQGEVWNRFAIQNYSEFLQLDFAEQRKIINEKLLALNLDDHLLGWYDNLFKTHIYYPEVDRYLIDIYQKPFDQEKGFQVYESKNPRITMMIIQLEKLNELEAEIGSFLGCDLFKLINKNIGSNKPYKELYKTFLDSYQPSSAEIEKIYNSRFMKYFYSPAQLLKFVEKWSK